MWRWILSQWFAACRPRKTAASWLLARWHPSRLVALVFVCFLVACWKPSVSCVRSLSPSPEVVAATRLFSHTPGVAPRTSPPSCHPLLVVACGARCVPARPGGSRPSPPRSNSADVMDMSLFLVVAAAALAGVFFAVFVRLVTHASAKPAVKAA